MPEMDGLEATAAIRQREQRIGGHVPIVAMTAHAMKGDGRSAWTPAWTPTWPSRSGPNTCSRRSPACSAAWGRPPTAAAEFPGGTVIDWPHALQTVRGDRELLKSIVEAFLEECPTSLEKLNQALAVGDTKAVRLHAHSIKGAIRYFGAKNAFDRAYQLEIMGRDGKLEDAAAVLAALEQELNGVLPPLKEYIGKE